MTRCPDLNALAGVIGPRFAEAAAEHDASGSFIADNYAVLKDHQVFSALIPVDLGGGGAPYSAMTVVTEFFDLNSAPNGDNWMTVTTKVEDPVYFTRSYLTTTDFKKLPDAAGWNPTPCSAR